MVNVLPVTFTPTTITPAYIGCNGNVVQGGTATLSSNATCLQDYSIINGIDHTAYNLVMLDRVRKHEVVMTPAMVDISLEAGDLLRDLVAAHRGVGQADLQRVDEVCAAIDRLRGELPWR